MEDNNQESDPKFEIQFYASILERYPNYIEAIEILGCLYTETGQFENGLDMDERAVKIKPTDATAHYNLACSQALLNQIEAAIHSLEKSIELGYDDVEWLLQDEDIASLRSHKRFVQIIENLKNKC